MTLNERRITWWCLAGLMGLVWSFLVWWYLSSQVLDPALRCLAAGLTAVWVAGFVLIAGSWCIISKEAEDG